MTTELSLANANRIEALASRLDDLEKACAVLIAKTCDLERVVSLSRRLPDDYGRRKFPVRNGDTKAVNRLQGRSDAPESSKPTDRAQDTREMSRANTDFNH